jgi:hypothetical protein
MAESPYVVDGLRLGGHILSGSPSYLEYRCNPSEQFTGLTWCQRRRQETSSRGAFASTTTIVHSTDGTAYYVNRYLEPAFFADTEAMDDVRRLANKYGETHYVTAPSVQGAPLTLMATWGAVSLQPLDRARLADLAAGRDVRAGILIDHIGNFQRSASMGLPVYRVTGGAGYVWAASWDQSGRGTLRFLTIDPSRLLPGQPVNSPDVASNTVNSRVATSSAGPSNAAPADIVPPPVPQPSAQPSPTASMDAPRPSVPPPQIVQQPAQPASPSYYETPKSTPSPAPVAAPTFAPVTTSQTAASEAMAKPEVTSNEGRGPTEPNNERAGQSPTPASTKEAVHPPETPEVRRDTARSASASPGSNIMPSSRIEPKAAPPQGPRVAEAARLPETDAQRSESGSPAEQPRVVGPPIANQPTAPTAAEGHAFEWLLVIAVVILLAAVGYLLLDRRKRNDLSQHLMPVSDDGLAGSKVAEPAAIQFSANPADEDTVVYPTPEPVAVAMKEPPPLPMAMPKASSPTPPGKSDEIQIERPPAADAKLPANTFGQPPNLAEHKHFGIGLILGLVVLSALMSVAVGPVGFIPALAAAYLLPTIIAFKIRHHYAWALAGLNVFFGATGLVWLGTLVGSLTGPRKSALDTMFQPSTLGLSKAANSDPSLLLSDNDVRSGWKMNVVDAEIFSFGEGAAPVETGTTIKVFFKNPIVGIWRTSAPSSSVNSVRYNATTEIRCVAKVAAETKLRVGRTLGRTALTGIGAAILTGRQNALGAAFLDYRFAGDETDEVIAALIVFSDYSSIMIQSELEEFEKFCSLLPPHVLSDEVEARTAEEIDRIRRMAADGPRVLEEMQAQVAETERRIMTLGDQAKNGNTFAERDEGRIGLSQAEERLAGERAVLNAVDRRIKMLANHGVAGRQIA